MLISLAWLERYLDRPIDAAEAEPALEARGFPIESVETIASGDTVLDVEVTSNRRDMLSVLGTARELASATGRTVQSPLDQEGTPPPSLTPAKVGETPNASVDGVEITGHALDACPLYTARIIRGIKVGPSPDWLKDCLEAVGLRSVNNVVDVTNFVLLETGQPLHAFDLAKLAGPEIHIRDAKPGETMTAIDGSKLKLEPGRLVIADADRPQAVAGVMGGLDSEVTEATADLLLESAVFDPLWVRRASRGLKLSSDSSYRYERGVDPWGVDAASRRAAALILELAGGDWRDGVAAVGVAMPEPTAVTLRPERTQSLLGLAIGAEEQADSLRSLGMTVAPGDGGVLQVTVPSIRAGDLKREVDLIEEIVRVHGMADVPVRDTIAIRATPPQPVMLARRTMADVLQAAGYFEALTPSLMDETTAKVFADADALAGLFDPRGRADAILRPSVWPSLLACRKINQDTGEPAPVGGIRLYETASCWQRKSDGQGSTERQVLAMIADADDPALAMREVRGVLERLGLTLTGQRPAVTPGQHPSLSSAAEVMLGGQQLGHYGLATSDVLQAMGLQTAVILVELDLEPLLTATDRDAEIVDLPRFPPIARDLSIVVPEATPWSDIHAGITEIEPAMLVSLAFLGVFRGKQVGSGRKSVSLRLTFRDPKRTLRHEEVDPQVQAVVASLKDRLGAELRG